LPFFGRCCAPKLSFRSFFFFFFFFSLFHFSLITMAELAIKVKEVHDSKNSWSASTFSILFSFYSTLFFFFFFSIIS